MPSIDHRPLAILLMGPTGSGKTALALELAARWPLSLVSVDSALVYRGLDIGSAKPDAATLARHPHALIDIRDPEQPYSAAEFRDDALACMADIVGQGRTPLLVGGTGLYFRALDRGLSELPAADARVRATLEREAAQDGLASLHARLLVLDPVAGTRIHPNDAQRTMRALEVIALTGRPLSAQQTGGGTRPPYRLLKLALLPDSRAGLHDQVARRLDAMFEQGLVEEVERLRTRPGLTAGHPSMRAVGYRQVWQYLEGTGDLAQCRQRAIEATRQLAKRQFTWLRGEFDALPIAAGSSALSIADSRVALAIGPSARPHAALS